MKQNNIKHLLSKLEQFRRRYYLNKLIRGILYSSMLSIGMFLIFTLIEYYSYASSILRFILFYFYIVFISGVLISLIIIPLLKIFKIGKRINDEDAAKFIGDHFPEISDKLLNTIQLQHISEKANSDLLLAGINQKIEGLKPFSFWKAIDYKENLKYVKWLTGPLLVILLLFFISPSTITKPVDRIIHYQNEYLPPQPFEIKITNTVYKIVQYSDISISAEILGEKLPSFAEIVIGNKRYRMSEVSENIYEYKIRNVKNSFDFFVEASGIVSKTNKVIVFPKPSILEYTVEIRNPAYTNLEDETKSNISELTIAEGATVDFNFFTQNASKVKLMSGIDTLSFENTNSYHFKKQYFNDEIVKLYLSNDNIYKGDSLSFEIHIIKDSYPEILVEQIFDSTFQNRIFNYGIIKDDFGFMKLEFLYRKSFNGLYDEPDYNIREIEINKGQIISEFYKNIDLVQFGISPGESIEYFFKIWDNDELNGSKFSETSVFNYEMSSYDYFDELVEEKNEEIKEGIEDKLDKVNNIDKLLEKLKREINEKEQIDWNQKKSLEEILNLQEQIINESKQDLEKFIENQSIENQFDSTEKRIFEKQKQLEELFEQLLDPELQKLIEELHQLLRDVDKNKINDLIDKIEFSNKEIEEQLDRNLELFKQFELEKKISQITEDINELHKKQDELANQQENDKNDSINNEESQEEINEEFEKIKEDLNKLEELNQQLEKPKNMKRDSLLEQTVDSALQQAMDDVKAKDKKEAKKSMQKASEGLKEMEKNLQSLSTDMEMQAISIDIDLMQRLIDNLLYVSFTQEDNIQLVYSSKDDQMQLIKATQNQKVIDNEIGLVRDSLKALAKRQPMLGAMITKEIKNLEYYSAKSLNDFVINRVNRDDINLRFTLTSTNTLILMLQELLERLENMSDGMGGGDGKNKNPNNKGKGSPSMKEMQDQLNKQISSLKQQMKNGKGSKSRQGLSKEFAKMAAEQEAIRRQLQEKMGQFQDDQGLSEALKELGKLMEESENDLLNKNIDNNFINRQNEILTKLLESENAENKRDTEKRRESKEGKVDKFGNPIDKIEYKTLLNNSNELLKRLNLEFKSYYNRRINTYLLQKNNEK